MATCLKQSLATEKMILSLCAPSDISSLTTGRSQIPHVVEEHIEMLRSVLPDTTIIAALDIIYREDVIKYKTSCSQHHCEVLGITSTYTVFPHLDDYIYSRV
ncbi:uncharacterized protein F5147DRAFT_33410 [Suillus discolor]|uniref:Uncharacterized protein n=1 Tax=Suillus discolor TaxID=1912936 RepID=A0A9P7JX81_9AGAM|nr:uncharacterized protein F5147DRAFT_33410 [Suillus discolor]KAG2113757.1 hypothetical protein F5147DRAFT_33410 [Suillus discolor]